MVMMIVLVWLVAVHLLPANARITKRVSFTDCSPAIQHCMWNLLQTQCELHALLLFVMG